MHITALAEGYLAQQHMMQLATTHGTAPWICTVYFVYDPDFNLYWISLPTRRHSQDIATNPNAAAAVAVTFAKGEKVVGLQFEGTAKHVDPTLEIAQKYADRFNRSADWVQDFVGGKTENQLYKLTPSHIYLFDDAHFPGGIRQQVL